MCYFCYSRSRDAVPAYNSDDEEVDQCAFCKESIDDPINYGKLFSVGKFKVHLFCCVSIFCINLIHLLKTCSFFNYFFRNFFIAGQCKSASTRGRGKCNFGLQRKRCCSRNSTFISNGRFFTLFFSLNAFN